MVEGSLAPDSSPLLLCSAAKECRLPAGYVQRLSSACGRDATAEAGPTRELIMMYRLPMLHWSTLNANCVENSDW